jgi:hypothetical protein
VIKDRSTDYASLKRWRVIVAPDAVEKNRQSNMEDKDFNAQNRRENCASERHRQGKVEEGLLDGFEAGKPDAERDGVTNTATPRKPVKRDHTRRFF